MVPSNALVAVVEELKYVPLSLLQPLNICVEADAVSPLKLDDVSAQRIV